MTKINITKTELVWPGKYNEDGALRASPRVNLPFQVIETINESRATREAKKRGVQASIFDIYEGNEGDSFEEGWKNKLIWGDNLLIMGSLLEKFAGKIDLIYIDPPFATGSDFSFTAEIGESQEKAMKEQSAIEEKAYRDTWGAGRISFLNMIDHRLRLMKSLLSQHGSIYVHLDYRVGPYIKIILDEIFGEKNFRNEIIWYYSGGGASREQWARKHDNIFYYSAGSQWIFNVNDVRQPYKWVDGQKRADGSGRDLKKGKLPDDVFDLHGIMPWASEKTGYETQKPETLLERIVKASSNPGDLVADFFCGSGTTAAVAERLGRRWIACDLGRYAIHVTRKRLLGIEKCKPFDLLNLGRYERQYWQGATFDPGASRVSPQALYEYLAFILRLYGASPVPGMQYLHGRKGGALVHVGSVDAPVTIDDIEHALEECALSGQKELHILGWEWEMGLQSGTDPKSGGLIHDIAKQRGVRLRLLNIPREVMEGQVADKGDVEFFELAYLKATVEAGEHPNQFHMSLTDFVIPNPDSIPEDIRGKITKWSDWIDYWAVDWNFRHDTFMQNFVAYRTRKNRSLSLISDTHIYEKAGTYCVLIKVIDVFGNDTSQAFDVEVK